MGRRSRKGKRQAYKFRTTNRVINYPRASSDEQSKNAYGIESQRYACECWSRYRPIPPAHPLARSHWRLLPGLEPCQNLLHCKARGRNSSRQTKAAGSI
jgi:hypothetical protein